jgi:peptidyl-prolyl cis-trans isomerase D
MLQSIRSTAGSWVVKILFVVLILSFGVWGIQDVTTGFKPYVAKVGSIEIAPAQLDREFRREVERIRTMMGGDFTSEQAKQLGLVDQTLERLIQRTLLSMEAKQQGLQVGDAPVIKMVQGIPAFHDAFDRFDADRMRMVLQQNQLDEAIFVSDLRDELARTQIVDAISSGTQTPLALSQALYRFRAERRVADTISVPTKAMPAPPPPDEATLAAWHTEHSSQYTAPEYRTLSVVTLTAAGFAADITVTDEELHTAYDQRADEFLQKESRTLAQAVVSDKAAAEAIVAAVGTGKSLEEAARAAGTEMVPLENVSESDLPPELAGPAFALAQGAVSGPVETGLGWHVLTVRSITAGGVTGFDQVKGQLLETLRQEKAGERLFEAANKMDEIVAGGTSLEDAAAQFGAQIVKVAAVDSNGNLKTGGTAANVPAFDTVVKLAFATASGESSRVTETPEGGFFIVKVDSVEPALLRPLDSIRALVVADWTTEQQRLAAKTKAEEVATALRGGADAKTATAGNKALTIGQTAPLLRGRNPEEAATLPPPVLSDLFKQSVNGVVTGEAADGWVVAKLARIEPADLAGADAIISQISNALTETISNDLMQQYLTSLRARHTVEINQTVLDQMYRTEP